jgi:hypothetical protein
MFTAAAAFFTSNAHHDFSSLSAVWTTREVEAAVLDLPRSLLPRSFDRLFARMFVVQIFLRLPEYSVSDAGCDCGMKHLFGMNRVVWILPTPCIIDLLCCGLKMCKCCSSSCISH